MFNPLNGLTGGADGWEPLTVSLGQLHRTFDAQRAHQREVPHNHKRCGPEGCPVTPARGTNVLTPGEPSMLPADWLSSESESVGGL